MSIKTYIADATLAGFDPASLPLASLDNMGDGGPLRAELSPLRLGRITGSQFHRVTRGRGGNGWSQTAETYLYELIGEWLTGEPASNFTGNAATVWGERYEPEAIAEYQRRTRRAVARRNEFQLAKNFQLVGCTPDGINRQRGIEVKCPFNFKNHLRTVITQEVPDEYRDQVNGHMLCTGRNYCDFISYDPRIQRPDLRIVVLTIERDRNALEELADRLYDFEQLLISHLDSLDIDWRTQ